MLGLICEMMNSFQIERPEWEQNFNTKWIYNVHVQYL